MRGGSFERATFERRYIGASSGKEKMQTTTARLAGAGICNDETREDCARKMHEV